MALGEGTRDTNDPQGGREKGLPRIKPENCASTGTCCHRLVISHFQSINGEETGKKLYFLSQIQSGIAFLKSEGTPQASALFHLVLQSEKGRVQVTIWAHSTHSTIFQGLALLLNSAILNTGISHQYLVNKHFLLLKNKAATSFQNLITMNSINMS